MLTLVDEVKARDQRAAWTNATELVAQVHELLQLMRAEHLIGLGVKAHNAPEVRRIRRPGDPPPAEPGERVVTPRQLALMTATGG